MRVYWHNTNPLWNIVVDFNGNVVASTGDIEPLENYTLFDMQPAQFEASVLDLYWKYRAEGYDHQAARAKV